MSFDSINGVKFTPRELDIIACVASGRSTSKISQLLTISPKTTETHIRNIFSKLGCHSRESIIDLVERSDQYLFIKQHYAHILARSGINNPLLDENIILEKEEIKSVPEESPKSYLKKYFMFGAGALSLVCVGIFAYFKSATVSELTTSTSVHSDFPLPPSSLLLRRSHLLKKIEETFKKQKEIKTVVLTGVGGAGKTTLARQYARSQKFPIVWEINAESHDTILNSLTDLAYALSKKPSDKISLNNIIKIKDIRSRCKNIIFFIKQKLRSHKEWLLIYDNVSEFTDIDDFFPHDARNWGDGTVLITSRNQTLNNSHYIDNDNFIAISSISEDQQFQLFKNVLINKRYQQDINVEESKEFLKNIPPYPMDTITVASYLGSTNISYENYLGQLKSNRNMKFKNTHGYSDKRYDIIVSALDDVLTQVPDSKELLLFISTLEAKNIPVDLLDSLKPTLKLFNHLQRHSLISVTYNKLRLFGFHDVTYEIMGDYLRKKFQASPTGFDPEAKALLVYIKEALQREEASVIYNIRAHLESFLKKSSGSPEALKIDLSYQLGHLYAFLWEHDKAAEQHSKTLLLIKKYYGPHSEKMAETLLSLGKAYKRLEYDQKAIDAHKGSLELYRKLYGPDHKKVAGVLTALANLYKNKGDYAEAQKLFQKALVIYQAKPTEYADEIAWTIARIGNLYGLQERYPKGRDLLEDALGRYKKLHGVDHIKTSWVLAVLGFIYTELGLHKKGERLIQHSLNVRLKQLGPDLPQTGWAYVCLGNNYRHQGKLEQSIELLTKGQKIFIRYYGAENALTARAEIYLAMSYRAAQKDSIAKPLFEKAINSLKAYFGERHPMTIWARRSRDRNRLIPAA